MKLHSSQTERRIRRAARRMIKASAELKREVKRVGKQRRSTHLNAGWLIFSVFPVIAIAATGGHQGLKVQLLCTTIFSTMFVAWLVTELHQSIYQSADLNALFHLPISNSHIFERQMKVFVGRTLRSIWTFLLMFSCVGLYSNLSGWGWIAAGVLAIIQYAIVVISAILLASSFPNLPYRTIFGFCSILLVALLVASGLIARPVLSLLHHGSELPFWIIPTGWTSFALERIVAGKPVHGLAIIGLLPLFGLTLRPALDHLRGSYQFQEPILVTAESYRKEEARTYDTSVEQPDLQEYEHDEEIFRGGSTEIADEIRSGRFLQPAPVGDSTWIETTLSRCLNDRERLLLDTTREFPLWSPLFKRAGVFVMAAVLVMVVMRYISVRPGMLPFFIVTYIFAARLIPVTNPLPLTFMPLMFGGTIIQWYSGFPLGFRVCSRLILKLNSLRLLIVSPFLTTFGIAAGIFYGHSWQAGLETTLKILWILLVIQPVLVVFFFSGGTNDSSQGGWKQLVVCLFLIGFILLFVGLGAVLILADHQITEFACGAVMLLFSSLIYFTYQWRYNRARFDLIQLSQGSTNSPQR